MKPAQAYTTMKSIMHLKHSCIFLYKVSLGNIYPPIQCLSQSDDSYNHYKDIAVYPGDELRTGLAVTAILVTKETYWRYNKYSINPRYQQIVNVYIISVAFR